MFPNVTLGCNILSLVFCLLTSFLCICVNARQQKFPVKIAVFLDQNEETSATKAVLLRTVDLINKNQSKYWIELYVYDELHEKQIFEAGDYACNSVEEGIAAIFGPQSADITAIVQSVSSYLQIPHFLTFSGYKLEGSSTNVHTNHNNSFTFHLYPSHNDIAICIATIVKQNDWISYTLLYETEDALVRLKNALKQKRQLNPKVSFRQLGLGPDYRAVLKEVKKSKETRIILDCKTENLASILRQARKIKLLEEYHHYMLTNLDSHTVDWSEFLGVDANITSIKLLDSVPRDWSINKKPIRTRASLLHDSLILFSKVIAKMDTRELNFKPLDCDEDEKADHGHRISELVRKETHFFQRAYLSGSIKFDKYGQRSNYTLHITEFNKSDVTFSVTSTWDPSFPNTIKFKRTEQERQQILEKSIQEKNFKVVSRIGAPYLMLRKEPGKLFYGNDRYEGYALDLMSEICKIWNCTYTFELVPDGNYGQYNHETKEWDGLIRHLLDRKADLAVCDLTITYDRRTAVDFTLPFMTLGISILYSKTVKEPPELLAFTKPLSLDIWLYMATSYLVISIIIFLVARLNPNDWENPHPCEAVPEELENIWNIRNCCWLTLGSIMAQGCDILPKGISTRMVTGMWWFFSLIMTASYTANLAAFLTMERMGPTIESAEDLASQSKIKYGCLSGGSTFSFFKESNFSTFHRMWVQMEGADPSVFEASNADGVKRVLNNTGRYAFLMESSSIEYQTERNCELRRVGGQLDSKGYGIAMPKDFPFRKALNEAILRMQEMGVLHRLKTKWWVEMNGGGACKEDKHSGEEAATELGLDHVGGVFVVLVSGIGIAFAIAMCEFLWHVRKVIVKKRMNIKEAFSKEIKFAMNIWARQKEVIKETTPSVARMEHLNGKNLT